MFLMWELPELLAIQEVPGQERPEEREGGREGGSEGKRKRGREGKRRGEERRERREISRLWLPRAWKKAAFRAALKGTRLWFWQEHPLHSITQ